MTPRLNIRNRVFSQGTCIGIRNRTSSLDLCTLLRGSSRRGNSQRFSQDLRTLLRGLNSESCVEIRYRQPVHSCSCSGRGRLDVQHRDSRYRRFWSDVTRFFIRAFVRSGCWWRALAVLFPAVVERSESPGYLLRYASSSSCPKSRKFIFIRGRL